LARSLCRHCRYESVPTADERSLLERLKVTLSIVYNATGCDACFGLGYKGRVGVFELLVVTPELRSLIIKNASVQALKAYCIEQGMKTLIDDGIDKIRLGILSPTECARVIL
jgi:type II secretory ATPase GspE/PulE/Tfp pilus assembly ATPase PilB-like protein